MELVTVKVNVENFNELKELLQKALNQLELLENTMEQIKDFHLETKQEKATAATVVEKKCIYCGKSAELQNDNDSWICEDCAQSTSSHATDMGY